MGKKMNAQVCLGLDNANPQFGVVEQDYPSLPVLSLSLGERALVEKGKFYLEGIRFGNKANLSSML